MKINISALVRVLDHNLELVTKMVGALGIETVYCSWYADPEEETKEAVERLKELKETHDIYNPIFAGDREQFFFAVPKGSDIEFHHFSTESVTKEVMNKPLEWESIEACFPRDIWS